MSKLVKDKRLHGLFCGLVRPVSADLRYKQQLTSNKGVQCTAINITLCVAGGACALVLQPASAAVCMQACIVLNHHMQVGEGGC